MNHLIFTAVLTACLGIGGYQQGPKLFEPLSKGLGQDYYHDPGQLNSSHTGSWTPLLSLHSTLSIAVYTSMYYVLTYFAGSFGRYNVHSKVFWWLMTVHPIITALTGFQFANLLPYLLQVVPTVSGLRATNIINHMGHLTIHLMSTFTRSRRSSTPSISTPGPRWFGPTPLSL
ncbi:hypothetical protein DSO57_1018226 [Entomophthora muscae]|uniref:Uncharacterized protein n=1 Tax=Entomophthora muscae TaxID=34485 RepID=A0ACC2RVQ1_9FUNG|nr:hypothetical protein DSO57_1018226 [Entomophthora muscae]